MPVLLDEHIADQGDQVALVDEGGTSTWSHLGERVNRWIGLLRQRGLRPEDRLACVIGNRREAFEVTLACLHMGVTVIPVNWHLTEAEISYLLTDSGCRALVAAHPYAEVAGRAATGVDTCTIRLVTGEESISGWVAAEPALAAVAATEAAEQCCGATMLYTSGTTGAPKGVVNGLFVTGAPFSRVAKLAHYARTVLDVPARGRVLLDGPWYHSSQLFFALLALIQGSRLVIRERFDPATTLATIDREQITAVHLVPTQFVRLLRLDQDTRNRFDGSSLRRVWHGGGPCSPEVKRRMIEWWGPILWEYYGATEGGVVTLIDSVEWLRRPGSVGRAVPPSELVVVDDHGTPVPAGQTGRVFVRRRRGERFRYHNAPEKTDSAYLAPDTFTYGELGHVDQDGYLFLNGRAHDLIVSGGVNVYPAEVEAVLLEHPAVRDAAVVGVPDDEFGERVLGIVVADPAQADELSTRLDAYCRRFLAGFKVPRAYRFVDELPRDSSGKLRQAMLRRLDRPGGPAGPTSTESV